MLGKINLINYEKYYPSRLKKFFRADLNYHTYDKFIPYMKKAVVGNIPPEVINLFNKTDKGEKIKSFQNALSSITKYLRGCYKSVKEQNMIAYDFKDLSDDLPIFETAISEFANSQFKGILPEGIKAELTFAGKGAWGNVFKFSLKNKKGEKIMHDKALKVYHYLNTDVRGLSSIQNNYAEANFWTYLKFAAGHKLDKTQFTKHYISDMKSGYAMTEFIDDTIPKTKSPIDLNNVIRLLYMDFSNEAVNGKLYDGGGFVKRFDFIRDKLVLRYFKKLWFRNSEKELNKVIKDFEQKIANPKTPHRDKIQRALELFKQKQDVDY